MTPDHLSPSLTALGWTIARAHASAATLADLLRPARVLAQHRGRYVVGTADGDITAILPGRLRAGGLAALDLPAVGDWVAGRSSDASPFTIESVLPRHSAFVRKAAGATSAAQVVAANIDVAFIVTSAAHDLNVRRLERYAALAWESGAVPVIVLTKADLASEQALAAAQAAARTAAPGVDVLAVSVVGEVGLDELSLRLAPGRTGVLMGSSGVGKSTLLNRFVGEDLLRTGTLSEHGRGRHTTTHRELVRLPSGAMLIDTPGMRELQLWSDGSGVAATFVDIEALAAECRYSDCSHRGEPGCRVRDAVETGVLPPDRLDSFRALQREVARLATRTDPLSAAAEKRRIKMLHRAQYAVPGAKSG